MTILMKTGTTSPPSDAVQSATGCSETEAIARSLAVSIVPDTSKHHCACMCSHCERRRTGVFAMREARGNYSEFLRLVDERGRGEK